MSLLAAHGLLLRNAGAPHTVLSSINKAPDIILANGNIDAETTVTEGGIALSAAGKSAGKLYVECIAAQVGPVRGFGFGLHRGTAALTTYIGGNANGWATWVSGTERRTFTNGVQANNTTGHSTPSAGIRALMSVDLDEGKVWLTKFGQSTWVGGGNPAAGTSPTYSFTPGGDTFYIALCPYHGQVSPTTSRNRLRLVVPGQWAFPAPTGFNVWTP